MSKPYLIFAPSYSDKVGGTIALHKLCHLLNTIGAKAYLVPAVTNFDISIINQKKIKKKLKREGSRWKSTPFGTNPYFNTPMMKGSIFKLDMENFIAVYPEVVTGNPFSAKHVVRWFLHSPGHHRKEISYSTTELHYDYNSFLRNHRLPMATTSPHRLYITHTPTEIYNMENALPPEERRGTAYCIKKGAGREIMHDLSESTLIDSLSHHEIAKLFKTVKTFISYDAYTSYSVFAALCGADSVIVPEPGVTKSQWHPDKNDHLGLAYGFDDIPNAKESQPLLCQHIKKREESLVEITKDFFDETQTFFSH